MNRKSFSIKEAFEKRGGESLWLLFFPMYLVTFFFVERLSDSALCHPVYFPPVDDALPFCEWFLPPYILWHGLMLFLPLYLFFCGSDGFPGLMKYLAVTSAVTFAVYLIYPSCQNLRPEHLPGKNLMTWGVSLIYRIDTSTNVCPSMHIIGAAGLLIAAWRERSFSGWIWRAAWTAPQRLRPRC